MDNEEKYINSLTYADISRALSRDFLRVFCVNTDTDYYVEYKPHEQDEKLDILTRGDSFREVVHDLKDSCYTEDFDKFRTAVRKNNILKVLSTDSAFSLDYRMMIGGKATYVKLKGVRIRPEDPSHILFGLSNTDAHMQRLAKYDEELENNLTFAGVSEALSSDYFCIYYVDMASGHYREYKSTEKFKGRGIRPSGDDFFGMLRTELADTVYDEDRESYFIAFDKENLERVLSVDRSFMLTYRVMLEGKPTYIRMKVTKMAAEDDHHIVVGLSNVDAHMKRIRNYQKMESLAYKDSLTGVRSKLAYVDMEKSMNNKLSEGDQSDFAVVVCDVNGLKKINDTLGHQAGDEYIRLACKMICSIFAHSPVFRIGGDEFAAILTGEDYENREALMKELHDLSASHIGTDQAVVSGGLGEYDPDHDKYVRDVLGRADAEMYKEKTLLKSLGAVTRDDESDTADQVPEDIPIIDMRKHLLIADDIETNREILGGLLSEDYDILYASDGVETMEMLRKNKDKIALLLLDRNMPNMNGREVIRAMQVDEDLMHIPVIMLTIDRDAELDSLRIGAMDFISKPYPDIDVVKARIAKCIELSEDRDLIRNTQRDKLTGLYNVDYFIEYVNRLDQQYKDVPLDAFVCDINQFRSVNKKYGRQYGDLILRSLGRNIRKLARKTGGIVCRQGVDTFLLYCPHQDDYEQLITKFKAELRAEEEFAEMAELRFGIFENANGEPDVEKRFEFAKTAAEKALGDSGKTCGYYRI